MVARESTQAHASDATTEGIHVSVRPRYVPEHSEPDARRWVFTYHVRIANLGSSPATLLARHWLIVDADGRTREVAGEGVIGEQPRLEPGDTYEYASFCPLETPWGSMEGAYLMRRDDGAPFKATIARFLLVSAPDPQI